ncbi:hypothetical protein Q9L58_004488 [Maublancomyces gigas]|uniref:Uncharacterized protein n=1 Tax=Discina gigas TaxID=1032678 RepID=A0ABR3GKT1_9PEZI
MRSRYTLANIPTSPTSPTTRRQGPRSNSPTRQWAYSQSPLGIPRGSGCGFYPSSPTLAQPPPPPSYLVNEPFIPSAYSSANSSSPSTPTSTRSRSPSISSLDTIPDSPDAEEEALEVEMKEALDRAAAKSLSSSPSSETDEDESNSGGRRSPMDGSRDNFGAGRRGAADKRKRWSVCGGEKRGDLELETIWEEAFGGGNNGGPDPLGIMNGDGMGDGEMI